MAKKISTTCMQVTFVWSFLSMAIVWFYANSVQTFYTENEEVLAVMRQAWYILIVFIGFDNMQGVQVSVIGGLGLITKVKWQTVFDYWVFGIPISIFMMFRMNLGIEGLWYGPTVAVFMNYIFYAYYSYSSDW